MRSAIFVAVSLFLSGVACESSQSPPARDLRQYEIAGPYTLDAYKDEPSAYAKKATEIREFLWNHWQERKRGLITVSHQPVDTSPITFKYFVEPDARATWGVAIVTIRTSREGKGPDVSRATRLERGRLQKSGPKDEYVVLENTGELPGSDYLLLMKDESGKLLRIE